MEKLLRWVTCIILNDKGQILLLKRSPDKKIFPNLWGFVSGGVSINDLDIEETVRREIKEELGLVLRPNKVGDFTIDQLGKRSVVSLFRYKFNHPPDININSEHTEFLWVDHESVKDYPLVPGMDYLVEKVQI